MRLLAARAYPRSKPPRAAGQFYDLFKRVDGYCLFEALLELACGNEPVVRRREGPELHAASFVLRDLSGEGLSRWPAAREIRALQARHPDKHVMVYPKRGADLAREMKWLGSYRYGVFNMGGATLEEMFARYREVCREITFHPRGHRLADPALTFAGDNGDD